MEVTMHGIFSLARRTGASCEAERRTWRRCRTALVILLSLAGTGCQPHSTLPPEERPMTASDTNEDQVTSTAGSQGDERRSTSRIAGPRVRPITFEGRRYEQILNATHHGLPQRTGYLAVVDDETNESITNVKVYDVAFDPEKEADVQDVFFASMQLDEAGRRLLIKNEHGKGFVVNLDDYSVEPQK
jgi:hypothetical protein